MRKTCPIHLGTAAQCRPADHEAAGHLCLGHLRPVNPTVPAPRGGGRSRDQEAASGFLPNRPPFQAERPSAWCDARARDTRAPATAKLPGGQGGVTLRPGAILCASLRFMLEGNARCDRRGSIDGGRAVHECRSRELAERVRRTVSDLIDRNVEGCGRPGIVGRSAQTGARRRDDCAYRPTRVSRWPKARMWQSGCPATHSWIRQVRGASPACRDRA